MKKLKFISNTIIAYGAWILSLLLWLAFMLLSQRAILGMLSLYYINDSFIRGKQTQFIGLAYIIVLGIVWVALMVTIEHYFRAGAKKGNLFQRIGKVLGAEFVLIFLSDFTLAFLIGLNILPWSRWLMLLIELAAAAGMIWLSTRPSVPQTQFQVK